MLNVIFDYTSLKKFIVQQMSVFKIWCFLIAVVQASDYYNPNNGKLYRFLEDKRTFEEQMKYCSSIGGSMLKIESKEESDWIMNNVPARGSYLGASLLKKEINMDILVVCIYIRS